MSWCHWHQNKRSNADQQQHLATKVDSSTANLILIGEGVGCDTPKTENVTKFWDINAPLGHIPCAIFKKFSAQVQFHAQLNTKILIRIRGYRVTGFYLGWCIC